MIIGLDIGYGYTKAFTKETGEVTIAFPSITGNVEEIRFTNKLIGSGGGQAIAYDGHRYWYGEMALLQSRVANTLLDRSRVSDDHARLLFIASLVELAQAIPNLSNSQLRVVTGLPVSYYADRTVLQRQMLNLHHVMVDSKTFHFNVTRVVVLPQPFGAMFAVILNENGVIANEEMARSSVGVIDIGTFTTDLVVMRPDATGRPTYIEMDSTSVDLGLSKVLALTQRNIADQFGLEMSLHEVDKALMLGQFTVRDQPHAIEPLARPHLNMVSDAVMATARELWGTGLDLHRILITGGGGKLFQAQIKAVYPHAQLLENPFWANVRGFYRYGQRPKTFQLD